MSETDNRPNASAAGTFDAGGDLAVNRLGFGPMRLCGPGVWGSPRTRRRH
jgi:pyridoxine 4-dehydrogenase